MNALEIGTVQEKMPLTILQRIAEKDKTAVKDCIDAYGNLVWTMARKFTNSTEEAEAATQKIFLDIWQNRGCDDIRQSAENLLIIQIAIRRLIKLRAEINS